MSYYTVRLENAHRAFALQAIVEHGTTKFDWQDGSLKQRFVDQYKQAPTQGRQVSPEQFWPDQVMALTDSGCLIADGKFRQVAEWALPWIESFRVGPTLELVLFGVPFSQESYSVFRTAMNRGESIANGLSNDLAKHLRGPHATPPQIENLRRCVLWLSEMPIGPRKDLTVDECRQAAVIACRDRQLELRRQSENLETLVRDRSILRDIERELSVLDDILEIPALRSALTTPKPRITDFVNVGVVEKHTNGRPTDEKFGILTAPHQFSTDFDESRDGAFARGRSFAVGFIDIDDFKIKFNNVYKETIVDRDILPTFMRALEAYCYRRAYAYRQGGDEYLVLLHNANPEESRAFFEGLQAHLRDTPYPPGIESNPTVSIGVHVIDDIHEVTEFEAKRRANLAKDAAKDAGRDTGKGLIRFWADL